MTKAAGDELPADVVPCKDFAMSDAFRDWAVGEMRKEVAGLVSKAGLDRVAMVKGKAPANGADGAQNHQSRNK